MGINKAPGARFVPGPTGCGEVDDAGGGVWALVAGCGSDVGCGVAADCAAADGTDGPAAAP
jgi:hypothetical protein